MQWLKLAVSGSDVEFDRGYFSSAVTASIFSGSHQGNGSGLTNIMSASYAVSASWAPGGTSNSLGNGFVNGGGYGVIPQSTSASLGGWEDSFPISSSMVFVHSIPNIQLDGPYTGFYSYKTTDVNQNSFIGFSSFDGRAIMYTQPAFDGVASYIRTVYDFILLAGMFEFNTSNILFTLENGSYTVTDSRPSTIGMEYGGDYGSSIKNNDRSIPDVGTIRTYLTASYAVSASWAPGGQSVTASYALTASYLDNANLYYVHTQSSNDVLWTVNHNLGADYVNVTVWSGSDVVIPQRITRINNNTIHIVFPVSESGYVVTTRGTFTQTSVVSSSYALTSSFASGGSGSFMGNGSGLTGIISASYATSASYAPYTYISIGTTAPATPSVNDLWIDTN